MGQYQDWLYYQKLDRQLRDQLQVLETRSIQVQNQIFELRKRFPHAQNPLVLALIEFLARQETANGTAASLNPAQDSQPPAFSNLTSTPVTPDFNLQTTTSAQNPEDAYSAQPGQPDPYAAQEASPAEPEQVIPPLFSLPLDRAYLQGARPDNRAQFDSGTQWSNGSDTTGPSSASLEIPDWLQHISVATQQGYMPIDPESVRTNRLVQRWLTRWGKQIPPDFAPQPPEGPEHE